MGRLILLFIKFEIMMIVFELCCSMVGICVCMFRKFVVRLVVSI